MADALDKIRGGLDKARTKLAAQRLGGRDHVVKFITYTVVGAVPDAGVPGTRTPVETTLAPVPVVQLKPIYRKRGLEVVLLGDARVSKVSRAAYTIDQLMAAETWLVNGVEFSLVQGELQATAYEFTLVLKQRNN